ncbi:MAG TPA: hypothetical protein EYP06_01720 [Desulfobacterales bacterium]|nr:hypothetical protein [Desulfobacterales bacterium]
MSIRLIAKDLYRAKQEVERLKKELAHCPPDSREKLERELAKARAEVERLHHALEGAKEPPKYRKPPR